MLVTPLRALQDNYIFGLESPAAPGAAVLVDPGEAAPALRWLLEGDRRLQAILLTHHHHDHVRGVSDLLRAFPGIPVYGGAADRGRIPGLSRPVSDGERVEILGSEARVLFIPAHTRGHIAWFLPSGDGGDLFAGDTLFAGTIGNLFEGTADDMLAALRRIRELPPATRVWCAHEYTRLYLPDALALDPQNERLKERLAKVAQLPPDTPTVPLSLAEELATNPFLRWDDPAVRARLGTRDDRETFKKLCDS